MLAARRLFFCALRTAAAFYFTFAAKYYIILHMKIADGWKDYKIIATGDGMKLERWGDVVLLRPDPQVIWRSSRDLYAYGGIDAVYRRSAKGGGGWEYRRPMPEEWQVGYRDLKFVVKPMGFKHTGLFPEQAVSTAAAMTSAQINNTYLKKTIFLLDFILPSHYADGTDALSHADMLQ